MLRDYMLTLGYSDSEIDKIINKYPLNMCKEDTLYKNIQDIIILFTKLGLDNKKIKKIIVSSPSIVTYSVSGLNNKIEMFKKLGYSNNEILKMLNTFTLIFCFSDNRIKK